MIILATGRTTAKFVREDERIEITIPSGKDEIVISLALHDAMGLTKETARVVSNSFDLMRQRKAEAEVIAFAPKPKRGRR